MTKRYSEQNGYFQLKVLSGLFHWLFPCAAAYAYLEIKKKKIQMTKQDCVQQALDKEKME